VVPAVTRAITTAPAVVESRAPRLTTRSPSLLGPRAGCRDYNTGSVGTPTARAYTVELERTPVVAGGAQLWRRLLRPMPSAVCAAAVPPLVWASLVPAWESLRSQPCKSSADCAVPSVAEVALTDAAGCAATRWTSRCWVGDWPAIVSAVVAAAAIRQYSSPATSVLRATELVPFTGLVFTVAFDRGRLARWCETAKLGDCQGRRALRCDPLRGIRPEDGLREPDNQPLPPGLPVAVRASAGAACGPRRQVVAG
jgi:hypothetical protein